MTDHTVTPAYSAACELAHIELLETADRLVRDGHDWRAVLTAFLSGGATIVSANVGAAEVPKWFARAAAMTMHFGKDA